MFLSLVIKPITKLMKNSAILLFFLLICFTNCGQVNKSSEQTEDSDSVSTFYFIRHAEKDRSNKANINPHLTEQGLKRANHWNDYLNDNTFDAVYSTDFNRTRETATPTAEANNLDITIYDASKINSEKLKSDHIGETVLIVGHSNTIPGLVNSFIEKTKYKEIDDSNSSNIYKITIEGDQIKDELLEINPR